VAEERALLPVFFDDADAVRAWVGEHAADEAEVWLGFHRIRYGAAHPGVRVQDAADEFTAAGWAENARRTVDGDGTYAVRFAPAKPKRVRAPRALPDDGPWEPPVLSAEYDERLRADPAAWEFFEKQSPKYRRTAVWWVMSGKAPETRERRISALVAACAAGERVAQLQRQM
jgi:uncharacterized protein YdeI (YjbR/CyaY-like superfamily)